MYNISKTCQMKNLNQFFKNQITQMNIVTIFDYNWDDLNNQIMLQMFVGGITENCKRHPYNLWIITSQASKINPIFSNSSIRTIQLRQTDYFVPSHMPNLKNKLYNLCNLDFEFIYLDCDMYVASDLSFLWDRRKDKPFISTIHQKNIKGVVYESHVEEDNNFMNSGLQIVSDPSFLDYEKLYDFGRKLNFKFPVPGSDQALLDTYFNQIGYDFIHKDIGCEWNSCAGYGLVDIDDEYNFKIRYKNQDVEYQVKINHYWNEFKPWAINCPIFNLYKNQYVNRIAS